MAMRCAAALSLLAGFAVAPAQADQPAAEFFENRVRPLLVKACQECHGPTKQRSALRVDSRAALLRGGDGGPAIVPGDPAKSLLIQAIMHRGDLRMPPRGRLNDEQVNILKRWVEAGAPWPGKVQPALLRTGPISDRDRNFWSFQPIRKPALPAVHRAAWPRTEVDSFILARLEASGLQPAPPADRPTLVRRASFDLIGLPPTPEELEAASRDPAADWFDKVVERLLASPHYGERWGRHWLDVVRYADTAGETADYPVPEAYRYRNYVIDAFNTDKPYNTFLREQLAGDILAAAGPTERYAEQVIATGFLALSRRFGFDPESYHHLTIQDSIDTLGQAVLGLTLGCARCHDHKYDPVSRADYYALYGIFASTRYPYPGSEKSKRPADFVPLSPARPDASNSSAPAPLAYAVSEGQPHEARIHRRGEPHDLGEEVPRRFLEILGGQRLSPEDQGSGRRSLADWLVRPDNPLTARVFVNRVWQHHFGTGLVATPNDFGVRGQRPSHPELLDYLAWRFQEEGWSIKALHRLILRSRVYQTASRAEPRSLEVDPHNRLLAHFPRRRLDAESIRDALLMLGGNLDRTPGGPHPFPPVAQWNFTQHAPFAAVYDSNRRSVYLMTPRLKRHPFLALFDGADPNASTAQRGTTTVPPQALFFLNASLVHSQAEGLARRLLGDAESDEARIALAYRRTLGRPPSDREVEEAAGFLGRYRASLSSNGVAARRLEPLAWAALARTLFARNEFIHVD